VRVLLSAQIRRREFGKSIPAEDLPVIARSARAALAVPIAVKGLPAGTRLLKAYATSPRGAKRVVYLLVLDGGDLFLPFYRGKDDPLGRNVSLSNPAFRKALDTHLNLLETDIARGDIEPVILP